MITIMMLLARMIALANQGFMALFSPTLPAEHCVKLRAASILAAPLVSSFNALFGRLSLL